MTLTVCVGGCGAEPSSTDLFVFQVIAPQMVKSGQACAYTGALSQPSLSAGTLDIVLRPAYDAELLLSNFSSRAYTIRDAVVRIADSLGDQLATYTRPAFGTVPPANGGAPGFAAIGPVTIVDAKTAGNLNLAFGVRRRLVVFVRFSGEKAGGGSAQTREFEFPVDVCAGCLISFSAADINPACASPNCYGNSALQPPTTLPCVVGEDLPIDCRFCRDLGVPECSPKVGCSGLDSGTTGGD